MIRTVEELFECRACQHPCSSGMNPQLVFLPLYHHNSVCERIRRMDERVSLKCTSFDRKFLQSHLKEADTPFYKQCHVGLIELVIPIRIREAIQFPVFLGPFRSSNIRIPSGTLRAPTSTTRWEGAEGLFATLPKLTDKRSKHLMDVGIMLKSYVETKIELYFQTESPALNRKESILAFIDDQFSDSACCLETLARYLGLSFTHASRVVTRLFGIGFSELLLIKRLDAAKDILRNSEYPIETTARMCGFSSKAYFHRAFKKRIGETPTEFRR